MYRKKSIIIQEWLRNSNKALLVTGARQTGKTWLIRDEIEKSGYSKFEINFIDQPDMIQYLNAEISAEEFLVRLRMIMPEKCKSGQTVVFFDEIQKCPEIVTKIKFLVDDASYRYVMSGSLSSQGSVCFFRCKYRNSWKGNLSSYIHVLPSKRREN